MNYFKKLSIALALVIMGIMGYTSANAAWNSFGGGNGTASNPWLITGKNHLDTLEKYVNNKVNNNQYTNYCGYYFKLTTNITTAVTKKIGIANNWFAGSFDGNGYTIALNLTNDAEGGYVALFSRIAGYCGATIKNLTVSGTVRGNYMVAGIIGYAENRVIVRNCTNLANVTGDVNNQNNGYAAGIVAHSWSPAGAGLIVENCANAGNISGNWVVAGIVGQIDSEGKVRYCTNIGNVAGGWGVGGIVGVTGGNALVEHCMNAGWISRGMRIGGIVGQNSGESVAIRNCLNVGVVEGNSQTTGTILGYSEQTTGPGVIYCFYDKQMTIAGIGGVGTDCIHNYNNNGTVAYNYTVDMTNNYLQSALGTAYWDYEAGMYPRPKNNQNYYLHYVAACPVNLYASDNVSRVNDRFTVRTYTWKTLNGKVVQTDLTGGVGTNRNGISGRDILEANISGYKKQVPIDLSGRVFFKATLATSSFGSFTVSEVMPTIVSESAGMDVEIGEAGNMSIAIYDLSGSKIMDLANQFVDASTQAKIEMNNLSSLASGTYSVVVTVGNDQAIRRFVKQ